MAVKHINNQELLKIIKNNPLIDEESFLSVRKQVEALKEIRIRKHQYDLVIPYSRKVSASAES